MQVTWRVRGNIMLKHNNPTIANGFGDIVPVKDVQVKVSAREKLLGIWGPFNSWDTVTTDSNGFFEVKKEKDKSDRQFKIEVLFKDDTLKIYPENDGLWDKVTEGLTDLAGDIIGEVTRIRVLGDIVDKAEDALEMVLEQTGRLAYDVKWFKVLDEDKDDKDHKHGTIDFGDLTFGGSSKHDLNDFFAIRHATAWFVIKKVFDVFNGFSSSFHFNDKKPVALKYPHDNPIIGDGVEAAYCNPYNYVIFIIRNDLPSDWFNVDTITHELMHAWAYHHCTHEKAMAWQLLLHGGTHDGLQKKSFVAFHEGFAEWASNRLTSQLFGTTPQIYGNTYDTGVPFSRKFLKKKKVKNEGDIDKSEFGWISLFNILMTPSLHLHDFNSSSDYADAMHPSTVTIPSGHVCSSPALTFDEILSVFTEHESDGYEKVLHKNEMNLDDFLNRAADISDKMTSDHVQMIKDLLNPSKTNAAVDIVCPAPAKHKPPPKGWKPPKDLHEPPVKQTRKTTQSKPKTKTSETVKAVKKKPAAKGRKK